MSLNKSDISERSASPPMPETLLFGRPYVDYESKPAPYFNPDTIVITKGSLDTPWQGDLVRAICNIYPNARILERLDLPHNRVELDGRDPLSLHYRGKKTLVFGLHKSAVRNSDEDNNSCPNYWHFSPYGFCPYDCRYCYLAGTPGVKYSPTVKIFLNLPDILHRIDEVASQCTRPTSFYLGKLQDGLALDPLTGYSRTMVPFFARHKQARLTLLTKSTNVENLLDLDHEKHTILSWSLNPRDVWAAFERNVASPAERIAAMQACAQAGYPIRAVIMPIIPIGNWQDVYTPFLKDLLHAVSLDRITLGQICSYSAALRLTERKLGKNNPISNQLQRAKSSDGRIRFPFELRIQVYGYLIDVIRKCRPALDIGLCMEQRRTFEALHLEQAVGRCNCVL
jgi:spore photoproduct lyase